MPLAGEQAVTVVAWSPGRDHPLLPSLLSLADELANTLDLTSWG
ncbi:hypothetical protein Aab01nite_35450 [Paractinoplanes abujensis]|uniref:Uncharacterized protein n=1 Tax=Paractinoplanes abujensis TaxID=882441 RepID=A0A7W7G6M0_9ACTN|nr:hypothetical protein [Actinoplanes abujensis]MBB4697555.1 hypothetical protein [Actinoplanes abujensis]GID19955.1 hypothetical protein Aab01nite_35450 [Actinoplanes abujensis]